MLDWILGMLFSLMEYVAASQVTSVWNIKAIWDSNLNEPATKNIVYPEVIIH